MKISSMLQGMLRSGARRRERCDRFWTDDPYAHPDIDAMSERERADLPPTHLPARLGLRHAADCGPAC